MNTKSFVAVLAVAAAVATVGSQSSAKEGPGRSATYTVHTITGVWGPWDEDGGVFTANQLDASATKVQGLQVVNPDGSPVFVYVCPDGQEYADVVGVRKVTHSVDPIAGSGSPITGPYVIRTPVMKGIRTKVWGDEVESLVPVPCPESSAAKPKVKKPVPLPRPRQ